MCENCDRYERADFKILIIKLGALGDVLRTTALCEPLKSLYPESKIFWIADDNVVGVLQGNSFVDRVIHKSRALAFISHIGFDLAINLDLDDDALILAGLAKAKKKKGFWFDSDGLVCCSSHSAQQYLLLSHDDKLKKENKKTYQAFIAEIAEVPYYGKIIVPISDASRKNAKSFFERNNLMGKKVLGAVVGTGNRWITKRWPEKHFIKLFSLLDDFEIVVFGGSEEKDLLRLIVEKSERKLINAGHSNSIDYFFGLLDLCDVIVCCDTFALHASAGLGKKTVALFGPTSADEIEIYGAGEKIISDVSCACCYNRVCSITPNCMELITPETVAKSIRRLAGGK